MDQAVAGLLGAVIGGVLTSGSSWGLEAARARRANERAVEEDTRKLRQATRLINDELVAAVVTLQQCELKHRWPRPNERLSTDRWRVYGPAVARSDLDSEDWSWLADAYQAMLEINTHIVSADQDGVVTLDDRDQDYVSGVRSSLEDALEKTRRDTSSFDDMHRPSLNKRVRVVICGAVLAMGLIAVLVVADRSGQSDRSHGQILLTTSGVRALPEPCRAAAVPFLAGSIDEDRSSDTVVQILVDRSECRGQSWNVQLRRNSIVGMQRP